MSTAAASVFRIVHIVGYISWKPISHREILTVVCDWWSNNMVTLTLKAKRFNLVKFCFILSFVFWEEDPRWVGWVCFEFGCVLEG